MEEGIVMQYHKDMTVTEVLYSHEGVLEILKKHGLPCNICSAAEWETLEVAARVHACDLNRLLEDLNQLK